MTESLPKITYNLIFALIAASVVFAVLFFLPTTSEFFVFNKFTIVLVLTLAAAILWAIRAVAGKRFVYTRTPLDAPLFLLLLAFFAATFSSIDQFTSMVGAAGRFWTGFLPLASMTVLFFI